MFNSVSGYSSTYVDYSLQNPQEIKIEEKTTSETIKATETIETDSFSSQNEKKEENKYDGKIGFFSAVGNIFKGAAKSVVDGVKSCFTNNKGKFSLLKTITSIGTAALCIAVPAIGVTACTVGAVAGGIQFGKGLYKANTAKTDEQAKKAWQEVGAGGLTVAASVTGAKASMKAMKTSAIKSGAGSALDKLGKDATISEKMRAFKTDGINSAKYNLREINPVIKDRVADLKEADSYAEKTEVITDVVDDTFTKENAELVLDVAGDNLSTENAITVVNAVKQSSNKAAIKKAVSSFSGPVKAAYEELVNKGTTISKVVEKYGQSNVAQVIKTLSGLVLGNESISFLG